MFPAHKQTDSERCIILAGIPHNTAVLREPSQPLLIFFITILPRLPSPPHPTPPHPPQKMRRKEREEGVAVPAVDVDATSPASGDKTTVEENSAVKMGAEAFVAKRKDSEGYGQPDWETDETLEAYLSS